jgi:hypothetical protein
MCLPARQVVAHRTCEDDSDCVPRVGVSLDDPVDPAAAAAVAREVAAASGDRAVSTGAPRAQCLRPVLADTAERLVRLRIVGQPTVLYLGHPINLLTSGTCHAGWARGPIPPLMPARDTATVAVQDLRPRSSLLPVYLPLVLERLLKCAPPYPTKGTRPPRSPSVRGRVHI